jgi:hypothetical protein
MAGAVAGRVAGAKPVAMPVTKPGGEEEIHYNTGKPLRPLSQ